MRHGRTAPCVFARIKPLICEHLGEFLVHAVLREEVGWVLGQHGDALLEPLGAFARLAFAAEHAHLAAIGALHAAKAPEQRRLATAVAAHECEERGLRHAQVQAA